MRQYIRLEYRDCFSDEPQEIPNYLQKISRGDLLRLCSLFLARTHETVKSYLSSYFTEKNNVYINKLWIRLKSDKTNIDSYIITNIESSLRLYEYVFDNIHTSETTLTDPEVEMNIFRVYLLFNSRVNESDTTASKSTELIQENRAKAILLAQMFQYFDITNFNYKQELYVQTVKAIYLYDFLSTNVKPLYEAYLEYYDCSDWQKLLSSVSSLAYFYLGREDKNSYVNLLVDSHKEGYKWKCDFIEKLTSQEEIEDIDFRILRSHPIFKISEGEYCIIYGYFLLELIYKGVYFKLNELNKKLPMENQIKGFRSFYCDYFSERTLLYNVLQNVYGKKYIQKSGEDIKTKFNVSAEPDYYIRNGNKIFLFESKDIFISSEAKISNDYNVIYRELHKRLYYEDKGGKISNKAILQLLLNIKKILHMEAEWDNCYKKKSIKIYPIVVLHDNIYNCPGINELLNQWFKEELDKIKDEYNVTCIEKVTIINIDVFILYRDFLQKPENTLDKLISSYHKYLSQDIGKSAKTEEELLNKYKDRIKSFEYYLSTKYNPDYRKLLTQIAKTYIKE